MLIGAGRLSYEPKGAIDWRARSIRADFAVLSHNTGGELLRHSVGQSPPISVTRPK
jgi:hypothetical protein